jgi:hypothetical protein
MKKIHLLLFLLYTFGSHGQMIRVSSKIDSSEAFIGSWINYSLIVKHKNNISIQLPNVLDSFKHFEIIDIPLSDTIKENDWITLTYNLVISAYDSGNYRIAPIPVAYQKQGDTLYSFAYSDSHNIRYNLAEVDTSQNWKPLKDIEKIPIIFKEIMPFLLAFIIILATGILIYYWLRKRKKKGFFEEKPKIAIAPHILAIKKLRKLEDQKLWQKGAIKEYHIRISEIIREYIEGRFEIGALEYTTLEIMKELRKHSEDHELLDTLEKSLQLSDFVKFAKAEPFPDENDQCLKTAYTFVNKTKITVQNSEGNTTSGKEETLS